MFSFFSAPTANGLLYLFLIKYQFYSIFNRFKKFLDPFFCFRTKIRFSLFRPLFLLNASLIIFSHYAQNQIIFLLQNTNFVVDSSLLAPFSSSLQCFSLQNRCQSPAFFSGNAQFPKKCVHFIQRKTENISRSWQQSPKEDIKWLLIATSNTQPL